MQELDAENLRITEETKGKREQIAKDKADYKKFLEEVKKEQEERDKASEVEKLLERDRIIEKNQESYMRK